MPARLSRIRSVAQDYGILIEKPRKGSHWVARAPGKRSYPIPAGNGEREEIGDFYINGFCRCFGIDPAEFKKKL